jgi:hypothetical protein
MLSWSVPAEIAEMVEIGDQAKMLIYAYFKGVFREKEWCCQTGLNCRPLHYQWGALPQFRSRRVDFVRAQEATPLWSGALDAAIAVLS